MQAYSRRMSLRRNREAEEAKHDFGFLEADGVKLANWAKAHDLSVGSMNGLITCISVLCCTRANLIWRLVPGSGSNQDVLHGG